MVQDIQPLLLLRIEFFPDPHHASGDDRFCLRLSLTPRGTNAVTIGLGSLQVVLDKGQREDWFNSSFIVAFSVISMLSLLLLVYVELKHEHPIINLRLFRNVSFSAGNFIMFMVGFCLYSSIMLIPLFLQTLMGYTATKAGMVLAPGGLATLFTMPLVGAMLQKYDGRKIVLCGLSTGACAMFIMREFCSALSQFTTGAPIVFDRLPAVLLNVFDHRVMRLTPATSYIVKRRSIIFGDWQAGPMVATILVRRSMAPSSSIIPFKNL